MNRILVLVTFLFFIGCSKDTPIEEDQKMAGIVMGLQVEISYLNAQGQDLLDTNTPNALDFNEMKLFYLIDGQEEEVYNSLMAHPRNIMLVDSDTARIRVFVNNYEGNITEETENLKTGRDTCYLELAENLRDTVVTVWEGKRVEENGIAGGSITVVKAWLNGEEGPFKFTRIIK